MVLDTYEFNKWTEAPFNDVRCPCIWLFRVLTILRDPDIHNYLRYVQCSVKNNIRIMLFTPRKTYIGGKVIN